MPLVFISNCSTVFLLLRFLNLFVASEAQAALFVAEIRVRSLSIV